MNDSNSSATPAGLPDEVVIRGRLVEQLTYGENAWMKPAAYYGVGSTDPLAPERFKRIEGKPLSFVGFVDVFDRLLRTVTHIDAAWRANSDLLGCAPDPFVALVGKHGNLCGGAVSEVSGVDAIQKALSGDLLASLGGEIMLTFPVGEAEEQALHYYGMPPGSKPRVIDAIAAPAFEEGVASRFRRTNERGRLFENHALDNKKHVLPLDTTPRFRCVRGGGFVIQPNYTFVLTFNHPKLVIRGPALTLQQKKDLLLAWAIGSTSNSNTITIVKDGQLFGNAVCQQDRVGASTLALWRAARAKHDVAGAAGYSDSFFPFPDGLEVLIKAGISAVFTSSGSKYDADVFAAAEAAGISAATMPDEECRGFDGH